MMKFHVLTLFPEMITAGLSPSIIGRAVGGKNIELNTVNIRDFTEDKHGKVDDYPYGGGAGMLMQAQPVYDAHQAVTAGRNVRTVYVTPQGHPFDQKMAREFSREKELVILCGHYEGVDERVLKEVVTDYVSIGDYILTGGELAAMVIIDAVARLVPGVLGNDTSSKEESFYNDLLEYPQYSRPEVWRGRSVPKILLSGNHADIAKWRLRQSEERTSCIRPELYEKYQQKQQLIKRLLRDKRNNIHIIECLSRGLGEVLYDQGEAVAVYQRDDRICMVSASTPEQGRELLKNCFKENVELLVTDQDFMKTMLEESGFSVLFSCRQFLYTERTPLSVGHKDIRRLNKDHFEYVCEHYDKDSAHYIRDRLLSGVMYGAFVDGCLAGFIGMHSEGSLGMLYVDEAYRRQGLAASLVAYAANRMLEQGWTPYGHVVTGNEASMRLQEKLGFYRAKNTFWWMEKSFPLRVKADCGMMNGNVMSEEE